MPIPGRRIEQDAVVPGEHWTERFRLRARRLSVVALGVAGIVFGGYALVRGEVWPGLLLHGVGVVGTVFIAPSPATRAISSSLVRGLR